MKQFVQRCLAPLAGAFALVSFLTAHAAEPLVRSFDLADAQRYPVTAKFSADLGALAVLGTDGTVQIRNTETGAVVARVALAAAELDGKPAPVVFAFVPPSGELLAGRGTNLAVHDPVSSRRLRALAPTTIPLTRLDVSPDGRRAVADLGELPVKGLAFWNLADGSRLDGLPTSRPAGAIPFRGIALPSRMSAPAPLWIQPPGPRAFAPGGSRWFGVYDRVMIDVWDPDQGRFLGSVGPRPAQGWVRSAVALDDRRVAITINDIELQVVDPVARTNAVWLPGYPITGPSVLEIKDLAVSADGRRLAVAGMRMKSRRGVMAPAGDMVHDVPQYGEVQVWDVASAKVVATLRGRPTEKFAKVALDRTGGRVAAVHDGAAIMPNWTGAMQQSGAMRPTEPLRVTVWTMASR